jgi:hypothetical protein
MTPDNKSKEFVVQHLAGVQIPKFAVPRGEFRRFMQQPLLIVLGMLTGAGAAKTGHGAWAAGGIVALVMIYAGAAATAMATRSLAALVVRMRRKEVLAQAGRRPQR